MSQLFNSCSRYREQISLLASDVLPGEERTELDRHLNQCAACRQYHDEVTAMTAALLTWKQNFEYLEPREAALGRWERDLARSFKRDHRNPHALSRRFFDWCKELIWPSRRVWAGLAAIWVVLLAVNLSQRSAMRSSVAASASPSPELVRAFFEGEGFTDQPTYPAVKNVKPPIPQEPRSDLHSGSLSIKSI